MSMLLDALKKAALEKKGRESEPATSKAKSVQVAQTPDKSPDGASAVDTELHNTEAADIAESDALKEIVAQPNFTDETLALVEPDDNSCSEQEQEQEVAPNDNAIELPAPSVDLDSFDDNGYCLSGEESPERDIDPDNEADEASLEEAVDMSGELDFSEIEEITAAESEDERLAAEWEAQMLNAETNSDNTSASSTSEADLSAEVSLGKDVPPSVETAASQPAATAMSADDLMAEIVADALAQTEGVAAEVNPEEENENKQALANLIENGKRQREKIKRRQVIAVVMLFFITVVLAGGYYYFIELEESSLVTVNQYAPAPNQEGSDSDEINVSIDEEYRDTGVEQNSVIVNGEQVGSIQEVLPIEAEVTPPTEPAKTVKTVTADKSSAVPKVSKPMESSSQKTAPLAITNETAVKPKQTRTMDLGDESQMIMRMTLSQKIQAGYQAYKLQNFSSAKMFYSSALRDAPDNRDALLGLAATATRMGRLDIALGHYQTLLSLNPQDALAKSGVLSLASLSGDLPRLESEVKIQLSDHPSDAHLHFLLGSLYSSTGNWNGARESFYRAVELDKFNPDYVYNLAVSMDHTSSYREALNYYKQAKAISLVASPSFSIENLNVRISTLENKLQQPITR